MWGTTCGSRLCIKLGLAEGARREEKVGIKGVVLVNQRVGRWLTVGVEPASKEQRLADVRVEKAME